MRTAAATGLQRQDTADGAILFDASVVGQAQFDARWFDADHWRTNGLASAAAGGRGGVVIAHAPQGDWVLRHYHRGGLVARLLGDRYLWNGAQATRGFAELRLLDELTRRGFDVPQPVAARYRRSGAHYRADLITGFIADAVTLAACTRTGRFDVLLAQRTGFAVARMHAAGVYHADLNAHNILVGPEKVWLIDFDRGQLRAPQRPWRLANLARLRRSLVKIGAANGDEAGFEHGVWRSLMSAYEHQFQVSMKETSR